MRRQVVVIVGALAVATAAHAAPSRWSFTPPVGWKDLSAAASSSPALPAATAYQAKAFGGPGGAFIQVTYAEQPAGAGYGEGDAFEVRRALGDYVLGIREAAAKQGILETYQRRDDRGVVIVDTTGRSEGEPSSFRTLAAVDELHQVRALSALCIAPAPVCGPLFDSLALDRTGLLAFDDPTPPAGDKPPANRIVYRLGEALVVAVLIAIGFLILWASDRRARRRRSATP